ALTSRSATHRTTPHHSQPTLSKGKGGAKQNHNGAQHGAEVAPQEAVKDRSSIPMENDFKDFRRSLWVKLLKLLKFLQGLIKFFTVLAIELRQDRK
ncbi:MAG: hypothetical protein WCQ26_08175, partial [Pseudanabaena sp. ELA748]